MNHTILVTGGLGYLGSHAVVALINYGFKVFIVDNLANSKIFILERIKNITGIHPDFENIDLKDFEKLDKLFKYNTFNAVIHFASYKSVSESLSDPLKYYDNNINGLIVLLNCCVKYKVNNFIFSSSCTIYGNPKIIPVDEKTEVGYINNPYGKTKFMGEQILCDFCKAFNKKVISLRYFNPVGAHYSNLLGELPIGIPSNLVPYITLTALGKFEILSIWGGDYNTKDGTAIRDYIDVNDLIDAHIKAMVNVISRDDSFIEYYNLGTGRGYSVKEVIEIFEKSNNIKINYVIKNRRPGDIEKIYCDNKLAMSKLNWKPVVSMAESMKHAYMWMKGIYKK